MATVTIISSVDLERSKKYGSWSSVISNFLAMQIYGPYPDLLNQKLWGWAQ